MKFDHKKIQLRDSEYEFLTLVPRREKTPDYACSAISFELRGKYYYFLQPPFKRAYKPYIFFEGHSLYIVKNELKNEVYFFNKYSEIDLDNFSEVFSIGLSWQSIMTSFEMVTAERVFKKRYRGTGSFKDLQTKSKNFRLDDELFFQDLDISLFNAIEEFILFVKKIIIQNDRNHRDIFRFEELRNGIRNLYNERMNYLIVKLTKYSKDFQVENWTEWEEALYDWKKIFLEKQEKQESNAKLYIKEFQRICHLRKLSEAFHRLISETEGSSSKIMENTIKRAILSVGNRYGVDEESIINSFKKLFNVKSKKEVIKVLENEILKEQTT